VVTHSYGIVAKVVHRRSDEVLTDGIDIVIIVRRRLSLEEIPCIEEQEARVGLAGLLEYGRETCHTPLARAIVQEVIGEDIPMDIRSVDDP